MLQCFSQPPTKRGCRRNAFLSLGCPRGDPPPCQGDDHSRSGGAPLHLATDLGGTATSAAATSCAFAAGIPAATDLAATATAKPRRRTVAAATARRRSHGQEEDSASRLSQEVDSGSSHSQEGEGCSYEADNGSSQSEEAGSGSHSRKRRWTAGGTTNRTTNPHGPARVAGGAAARAPTSSQGPAAGTRLGSRHGPVGSALQATG